jgi:quercetin dioxygenase-like cupin family protein
VSRYTYPHTIENGAGERLTFLRRVPGPTGDRLEVENVVGPGAGPPMHAHLHQTEALTVQEGRIGYEQPGQPAQFAGPGETVVFAAGVPHRFWNAGEGDLRCTGYIEPADTIEYFLGALFDSARRNGGGRPDPFEAAFLVRRYRSEFVMAEIPAPVQRVVFPVVVTLGRLLGKYRRYADAPAPVRHGAARRA